MTALLPPPDLVSSGPATTDSSPLVGDPSGTPSPSEPETLTGRPPLLTVSCEDSTDEAEENYCQAIARQAWVVSGHADAVAAKGAFETAVATLSRSVTKRGDKRGTRAPDIAADLHEAIATATLARRTLLPGVSVQTGRSASAVNSDIVFYSRASLLSRALWHVTPEWVKRARERFGSFGRGQVAPV